MGNNGQRVRLVVRGATLERLKAALRDPDRNITAVLFVDDGGRVTFQCAEAAKVPVLA